MSTSLSENNSSSSHTGTSLHKSLTIKFFYNKDWELINKIKKMNNLESTADAIRWALRKSLGVLSLFLLIVSQYVKQISLISLLVFNILVTTARAYARIATKLPIAAIFLMFCFMCKSAYADKVDTLITQVSTASQYPIINNRWTLVAYPSLAGRSGIYISNNSTNTANFYGLISTSSLLPIETLDNWMIDILPGDEYRFIPVATDLFLWFNSSSGSTQTITTQQVRFKYVR